MMKPVYTINDETFQIWPKDDWSRQELLKIVGSSSINFDMIISDNGKQAFKFGNRLDFKNIMRLIENRIYNDNSIQN